MSLGCSPPFIVINTCPPLCFPLYTRQNQIKERIVKTSTMPTASPTLAHSTYGRQCLRHLLRSLCHNLIHCSWTYGRNTWRVTRDSFATLPDPRGIGVKQFQCDRFYNYASELKLSFMRRWRRRRRRISWSVVGRRRAFRRGVRVFANMITRLIPRAFMSGWRAFRWRILLRR